MIKAGIIGASGYTGLELIKLLDAHPDVHVEFAAARSEAGRAVSDVFALRTDLRFCALDDVRDVDVLFLCLPHGAAAEWAQRAPLVIDLSADHRLKSKTAYRTWYGLDAPATSGVYGLTELHRDEIRTASLIANPGCYPTSVLLAVAPVAGSMGRMRIIADCKSGTTGAGRSANVAQLFAEVNDNLKPYNIGHMHRHVVEMEQELALLGHTGGLVFSPHLLPVTRGMLSTVYLPWVEDADTLYRKRYENEPFVWILPPGQTATLQHAVHTNQCVLSLHPVPEQETLIVVSAIDNLLKGAAGQAVQNMNVRCGCPETAGLLAGGVHASR